MSGALIILLSFLVGFAVGALARMPREDDRIYYKRPRKKGGSWK